MTKCYWFFVATIDFFTRMAVSLKQGVFLISGKRTPFGNLGGMLRDVAAEDLFATAAQAAIRAAGVPPCAIDTVNIGQVCSLATSGMSPRHAALKAGVPQSTPVLALNKLSGSASHAIVVSAQEIVTGSANISLSGGMENVSCVPFLVRDNRFGVPLFSSLKLEDWLNESNFDTYCNMSLINTADVLADKYKISREDADEFAFRSQRRWKAAHDKGIFESEVVPVKVNVKGRDQIMTTDEFPRPDTTMEMLAVLPPFYKGGICTVGNITSNNDGATSVIMASEEALKQHNLTPLSRLMGWASVGVEPTLMGTGPVVATNSLLKATGLKIADIDLFEIHETYAAQVAYCARELDVDPERLNVNGGGVAIGHATGASGARLALHITHELRRRGLKRGIASISIGGGQGLALLLEAV